MALKAIKRALLWLFEHGSTRGALLSSPVSETKPQRVGLWSESLSAHAGPQQRGSAWLLLL